MNVTQAPPVLSAQQLAGTFASNARVVARQVAGLTHADSLIQPPARGNCLNWVLGHIAVHRDYVLEALGRATEAGLAKEAPKSEPKTVAQQVFFLCWHETYHTGQTEFLRQLAGTDDQVI